MTSPTQSETWRAIELAAREQVSSDLDVLEATPLEFGAHICWSESGHMATTAGFSVVHRVGFPQIDRPFTTCGEMIPRPIRWLSLSPRLVRVMAKCKYCEAEHARITRERAA